MWYFWLAELAQAQLKSQGLEGLLQRKRGPRGAHKLTAAVRDFLVNQAAAEPRPGARELARRVRERFRLKVHPRTIEKALKAQSQKRGGRTR